MSKMSKASSSFSSSYEFTDTDKKQDDEYRKQTDIKINKVQNEYKGCSCGSTSISVTRDGHKTGRCGGCNKIIWSVK
jgi:uncharacterized Fe-S radical SAM superfamily protein PflX